MNSEPLAQPKVKMKKTTPKNSVLTCVLFGVLAAGPVMAADIRYMSSGDYLDPTGWQGGVIPGTNDTARFNWGNNTVTLSGEAPLLMNFQMGVDESGQLVVNAGGTPIRFDPSYSSPVGRFVSFDISKKF